MESIGLCDRCQKQKVLFTDKNEDLGYYCRECSDIVGIDTT